MSGRGTEKRVNPDDVEVHIRDGCAMRGCGRRDKHFHPQKVWRAFIDRGGKR